MFDAFAKFLSTNKDDNLSQDIAAYNEFKPKYGELYRVLGDNFFTGRVASAVNVYHTKGMVCLDFHGEKHWFTCDLLERVKNC